MWSKREIDEMVYEAIDTALWVGHCWGEGEDYNSHPLCDCFSYEDVTPEIREKFTEVLYAFATSIAESPFYEECEEKLTPECLGYNYVLTSQGHGVGFWGMDLGELGEFLTTLCRGGSIGLFSPDCETLALEY